MGQQPNIELGLSDAPRPTREPGTPSGWRPDRPGEIDGPGETPWGGVFGRPGPATGYALKLVRLAEFDRSSRGSELEAVAATVVGARASLFGRAPTPTDVEVALVLLGLRPEGIPSGVVEELVERRQTGLDHAAHEIRKGTAFLAHVSPAHLQSSPEELVEVLGGRRLAG